MQSDLQKAAHLWVGVAGALNSQENRIMRYFKNILLVTLFIFSGSSYSAEWYEGGTLSDKGALEWQEATLANKIATSADFVALMLQKNMLVPSVSSTINSVNDLAPHAVQMATCIDEATKKEADPEQNRKVYSNQRVSSMAAVCATLMGWMQ